MNKEKEKDEKEPSEAAKEKAEEEKELEDAAKKYKQLLEEEKPAKVTEKKYGDKPKTLENLQDVLTMLQIQMTHYAKLQHNMITMLMETTNSHSRKVT